MEFGPIQALRLCYHIDRLRGGNRRRRIRAARRRYTLTLAPGLRRAKLVCTKRVCQLQWTIAYAERAAARPCRMGFSGGIVTDARRSRLKELKRLKNAPQDNTPADLKIVSMVVVAFLAALFLVTKLALGL